MDRLKQTMTKQNYRLLLKCVLAALLIVICVEILARRSVDATVVFMTTRPLTYLYNAFLVFLSLCFALLFRRRSFSLFVAGGVWIGVAIADSILISYRSMPLTAPDIWLMSSVRTIFHKYLSLFELGLLMFLIAVAIAGICYVLYRAKKHRAMFSFAATHFVAFMLLLLALTPLMTKMGALQSTEDFHNLPRAYRDNGFCYCFAASLITGGVGEPEDYSKTTIEDIKEGTSVLPETAQDPPNIVFVQLESFFDPTYLDAVSYETDAVPNFRALREAYPSGLLSVPCIGAGTANTEFEVLTGMNLSHFGVGEYPYMSIVDAACPQTLASSLLQIGYRTHAIHNNNATFYDRDLVYANLSFETFTSLEYMDLDPEKDFTPTLWAKDACLTKEIQKCLTATPELDLVFTVAVQPHGRYPSEYLEGYDYLSCEGMDESRKIGFEYYLYQLMQTDAFVGDLVKILQDYDEKTVVVFYGDHLPSFNIQPEELTYGNEQTTEYVIWANFDIGNEKRDLQTYQLAAYVMQLCGIYEGEIFRLHQSNDFPPDEDLLFQQNLQNLEYDMLEGEHFASQGMILPTSLRFDVEDISISSVILLDGVYHVYGQNFTRYSRIYVDDEECVTEFVSKSHLIARELPLYDGSLIDIRQISAGDELEILSRTEPYVWNAPKVPDSGADEMNN